MKRRLVAAVIGIMCLATTSLATVHRNGQDWVSCQENTPYSSAVCLGFDGKLYKCPGDQSLPCVRTP